MIPANSIIINSNDIRELTRLGIETDTDIALDRLDVIERKRVSRRRAREKIPAVIICGLVITILILLGMTAWFI